MAGDEGEVPDGAAVFPLIPEELGVHPLLLATLHALVFLEGSEETIVRPDAADEALEHLIGYLQRLQGAELERVREDLACLVTHARQERWPRIQMDFLEMFLDEYGVGRQPEA